ncbi:MAG: pyruvate, phosphate dikinase [Euryarchaeota archaeon]|nr:pyruvate, phosphate dikinase [Euryarchaeota archaeon]
MEGDQNRFASFWTGSADAVSREEFGNKAANLAAMVSLGVPVPPGFALGVSVCEDFHRGRGRLPADVPVLLGKGIQLLEKATGLKFGGRRRPLLVSVRSGAPVSLPGLMETILNVGLNRETLQGLVFMSGNPRFAHDSYRRLVEGFGTTVFGQDPRPYRTLLARAQEREEVPDATELDWATLRDLGCEYERLFQASAGTRFPQEAFEQLGLATAAVLRSWKGPKVESFRRLGMLKGARGTAVTVQAMVFGNMGPRSGAGVMFTRDPSTGASEPMLDFKFGVQGEDVVSGDASAAPVMLAEVLPEVHAELLRTGRRLEQHFGDMQDLEFTVQEGRLYILQSRAGKRAPLAALRIAVEMEREGLVRPEGALSMLAEVDIGAIRVRRPVSEGTPMARGVPASTGVASGSVALSPERARSSGASRPVILVRETASPEDLPGLAASAGLLTARGVRTSHAAVVARQLGKVCIVDCGALRIDVQSRRCRLGERDIPEGELITLDGNTGNVYQGRIEVVEETPAELLSAYRSWKEGRDPPREVSGSCPRA